MLLEEEGANLEEGDKQGQVSRVGVPRHQPLPLLPTCHAAGADRIKKLSPQPKAFQAEPAPEPAAAAAAGEALSTLQARSVIAVKLLTLAAGRSGVRLQVWAEWGVPGGR